MEDVLTSATTENQEMIAQMVRDFGAQHIRPRMMEWDESQEFPVAVFKQLGELGLMGVLILGFLLLLIPGFWLSVPASLFFFVKLRENLGFSAALSRAVALTKGHWWETFGLLLMISIIQSVLPGMVQIVGLGLVGAITALVGVGSLDVPMMTYVWLAVSNTFSLMMYSLVLLASTFQYFHLVEVKEGRGVYALLDQLGKPATAVNAPAEHRYRADEEGEY